MLVAQSCPTLCNPMDYIACQAPLSMGFSKQEHWSELPFPPPGIFPIQGSNLRLLWLLHRRQILYNPTCRGSSLGQWGSLILESAWTQGRRSCDIWASIWASLREGSSAGSVRGPWWIRRPLCSPSPQLPEPPPHRTGRHREVWAACVPGALPRKAGLQAPVFSSVDTSAFARISTTGVTLSHGDKVKVWENAVSFYTPVSSVNWERIVPESFLGP